MNELTMDERQNDVWLRKDKSVKYAVILMYRVVGDVKFITKGPMDGETAVSMVEAMLNACENNRYVCLNSHFVNPEDVVVIKIDLWKDKMAGVERGREFYGKSFYE